MRIKLTGYVFDGNKRYAPGEILTVDEQSARHIEKSGAGQILPEEDLGEVIPRENEVNGDGGTDSGERVLRDTPEQPGVGHGKRRGQSKGAGNRRKAT